MVAARMLPARPMLNSAEQVARWREGGEGRPCDVMIDTGMNRLGLRIEDVRGGALGGLVIETLLSHLASADERSEEHTSELPSLMRHSYAVFCLKKKNTRRLIP